MEEQEGTANHAKNTFLRTLVPTSVSHHMFTEGIFLGNLGKHMKALKDYSSIKYKNIDVRIQVP